MALMYAILRIVVLHVPHSAWIANVSSNFSQGVYKKNCVIIVYNMFIQDTR